MMQIKDNGNINQTKKFKSCIGLLFHIRSNNTGYNVDVISMKQCKGVEID